MRQPDHKQLMLLAATLLGLVVVTPVASAGIKCWTNSDGIRECGNTVPPEYAQQGHEEISDQGIVVDEKERALSEEEIDERRRQAAIRAEKARAREEQRRQDKILLKTFSNEKDIITARDDKLRATEAQIKLAESRIEKLRADLNKRVEAAAAKERAGKETPAALEEEIESLRRQIQANKQFIAETRAEQERIRANADADLRRFRELKAGD